MKSNIEYIHVFNRYSLLLDESVTHLQIVFLCEKGFVKDVIYVKLILRYGIVPKIE